ncbi:ABC transporter permease [Pontibacter sp. HSC-36F09]|uniref:ABC transporter permease n=1 Tax=Pontibacter sp. HSC-36F09 TaxID=2910966 RepID=UPI0020A0BB2E|nr:ABC transporter permease [Pontibacter sp. HSC-36F09]MCP2045578.1 lipopolysaccharide transport system permease protein [Pontibacter sp. HSC-36F09]
MPIATRVWEWEISSKTSVWNHSLQELWSYRHLLVGLVRRNFILNYQQTVLGPIWILFQPILTLITFVVVFHKIADISTGALPPVLFYASGIVLWNFLSDSFIGTASTFKENVQVFSKVYFPRIIMPISVIGTQLLRFGMQFFMLLAIIIYYSITTDLQLQTGLWFLAFPMAILLTAAISLGMGLLFSILTAKYRDMSNLVTLGTRLLMFVTPVIYPLSAVPENTRWVVELNPITPVFELFRLSILGEGTITVVHFFYSLGFIVVLLTGSMLLFNKQGDKLIDVV